LYGADNVIEAELEFFAKSNKYIDTCMNYTRPSLAVLLEPIRKAFLEAKRRGVRLRYLTEITSDNIEAAKELMKIVDELRHLNGIKGNFMVSESEYLAPIILFEKRKIASQMISSNVKEILDQHEYIFDTLWNQAVSAHQRIREIEEGLAPIKTRILYDQDEIIREIKRKNSSANKLSICTGYGGMQMSYKYLFDSYKSVVKKNQKERGEEGKGEGYGLRWITNVSQESMNLVKIFLDSGIRIRHVKNMPPISFGVSDKEVAITIEKMEGGKMSQSFLISNEPLYVNHFNSLFEELWKAGIDAKDRISDIEVGADLADIEVIPNPSRTREVYLELIKNAKEEILLMFPTTNAFNRQQKIGVLELAKDLRVKVRLLVPAHKSTEQILRQLRELNGYFDVRYIEQTGGAHATFLVVDRNTSLVMEIKDDLKATFDEAIGLSTYSNSRAGVLSYVAIFDSLWKQTELYEQLKQQEIMQKEFINVAAHELKTPIQPILGLTEVLHSKIKDVEQRELLEVTIRNAKRLQQLTNDILDVTKIEGRSLELKKEYFNLNDVVINAMNDMILVRELLKNEKIKLSYNPQDVLILADKARISQVISNLLSNAVKFTPEGTILISVEKDENNSRINVAVKDTGQGINATILPRLFTKFASKSYKGTGLGLFISKGIIEAHGGKIWGENNPDGKGAIFCFSLPV
jgi:signal transduction histidine kinase